MACFLHNQTELDPLIRMAVGHYQYEAIHPFTDGNGRTGRVLNIRYLHDLAALGVLREMPFGKEKLFIHPKLMQLLSRDNNQFQPYA
jgi:Fic/DOC family